MTRQAAHVFPRSLRPLPGETLAGLLLRMSYRHEQPPQHIARLSGLLSTTQATPTLSAALLLGLGPERCAALARSWGLEPQEAQALTLRTIFPNYAPLHTPYHGAARNITAITNDGWVLARTSRYCPACLAGDSGAIESEYGGAWQNQWRLPIAFACVLHNRMLESVCPACGNLAHSPGRNPDLGHWLPGRLVPNPGVHLHPAQCRTHTGALDRRCPRQHTASRRER